MIDPLFQEQVEYYRARAAEYEATALPGGSYDVEVQDPFGLEWRETLAVVRQLPRYESILELAAGTGIWTRELVHHTENLTVLDAAPEMLEENRANVKDVRVRYQRVNLFQWEPTEQYDLVFFAFWLSHVPEPLLDGFLQRVRRAVKPQGEIFFMDEPRGTRNVLPIPTIGNTQQRTLNDGRSFTIVKEYYDPEMLRVRLGNAGFQWVDITRGDYLFWVRAVRGEHDKAD